VICEARAPAIVCALLLGLAVADVAHFALSSRLRSVQPAPASAIAQPGRKRPRTELRTILAGHLFGAAPSEQRIVSAASDWVLNGVIATGDPHDGYAILAQQPQSARLWHTGAKLPGDAHLDSVYQDHVLLEVNGQLQSVALPRTLSGRGAGLPAPVVAAADNSSGVQDDPDAASVIRPKPKAAERWFDRLRGFTQAPPGGKAGFAMRTGQKGRFGFQNGDVVTAINGHPISDADAADRVLRQVDDSSVTFTVDRDGRPETIDVTVPP
jgi:type II secretion system protein C